LRRSIHWALALVAWSAQPADAEGPPVELEFDPCIAEDRDVVRKVVAVELGARALPATGAIARARIDCDGGATRISVDDPVTGKTLVRRIQLGRRSPAIRARVLGLAVAELVVASWVELEVNAKPAGVPVDAVAPPGDREAVTTLMRALGRRERRPPLRRFTLSALAGARRYPAGASLVAAGTDLEYRVRERLAVAIDLAGERGEDDTELGRIETFALSLGPRVERVATIDRLEMALGVGLRAGMAHLSATPMDEQVTAQSFTRPWAGGFLSARARALATDRWRLSIAIEGGFVAVGVAGRVEEQEVAQIKGPWIALWAGGAIGL
jgi:hypothetical protein